MKKKLFTKDFTLVVIGQIISLFGNATIRFALPLYLLNQTGSSVLFGIVTACAFIPAIVLSPAGGIVADRVNKRNVMVILDFSTAAILLVFSILLHRVDMVWLLIVTMMLLYGIAGAYQPSVQASVPALADQEHYLAANSVINTISSLASLTGPVLGGMLYSAYGLNPVLWLCIICFFVSAVMELFIRIPFEKQPSGGSILEVAASDLRESIRFIRMEKPVISKVLAVVCGINLFLSAMITVGMPYMITEVLDLGGSRQANQLYGYAQGALAAGGLAGGICAGIFARMLTVRKAGNLLLAAAACVFPMGIAAMSVPSGKTVYLVLTACCFAIMVFATIFTVQMMSFVQAETPANLIGKVIAVVMMVSMCAQPLGNALYGILFDVCRGKEYGVILFAGVVSLAISVCTKKVFDFEQERG